MKKLVRLCSAVLFAFYVHISISLASHDISLKLQWLDQFQFAGYYLAKERGFYDQAGLNVRFIAFHEGNQNVVDTVLAGEAQFGTGRSSLLAERAAGKNVVALAAIFQESPSILLTRDDTGIENVSDLIGRRVMITRDELDAAANMGMLSSKGLRSFDFIRQDHSWNIEDLINKKTDAMASYISNEPFLLKERNIGYRIFSPADYGQNYYGDLLFTSEQMIRERPETVRAFVEASLKGWAYAFDHIEESAQLIFKKYNSQKKSLESLIYEGETLKKLALKDGIPLGHLSADKIKTISRLYYEIGLFREAHSFPGFIWQP